MLTDIIVLVANTLISWGNTFSADGLWAVQDLVQTPRCTPQTNDTCCASCLGFSTLEYNILNALPSLLALPVVAYSGRLLDRFGAGRSALIGGIACVLGNVIRTAGSLLGSNHWAAFATMLVGDTIFKVALQAVSVVRSFVPAHCLPKSWRSIAFSAAYAVTLSGALAAFAVMHLFGHRNGVTAVLWVGTTATVLSPICGLLLLLFARSHDGPTTTPVARVISLWAIRPLLAILVTGLSAGAANAFFTNAVLLQVNVAAVDPHQAASRTVILSLYMIGGTMLSGIAVRACRACDCRIAIGGGAAWLAGCMLLHWAPGVPAPVTMGLIGAGMVFANSGAYNRLTEVVPPAGRASALSRAGVVSNIFLALMTGLTGVVIEVLRNSERGWVAVLLLYVATAVIVILGAAALQCMGRSAPDPDGETEPLLGVGVAVNADPVLVPRREADTIDGAA